MKDETIAGGKTIVERFLYPLVYEPGTPWEYSSALDWAGKLVERVNNNQTLTQYMERSMWTPLSITDVTFHIDLRDDMQRRMADLSILDMTEDEKMKFTEHELLKGGARMNGRRRGFRIASGLHENHAKPASERWEAAETGNRGPHV